MTDIFISYASEDLDAARRLATILEGQGWCVFWDRRIPAGKSWREVIVAELADARCVVVLWSQHSVTSRWVLAEADRGLERHVLIPALIENVDQPFGFGSIQAADLSTWGGDHDDAVIKQFLGDVAGVLGPAPVVPAADRPKAKAEAQRKGKKQQRQQAEAEAVRNTLEPSKWKLGEVFRDIEAPWCPQMVVIPAGSFVMGSTEAERQWALARSARADWVSSEKPQHRVRIANSLAVGRFPVTFAEYDHFWSMITCAERSRSCGKKRTKPDDETWGRGRMPVINVNLKDAKDFAAWLSDQSGKRYRLLSEAEWEYACRAKTTTRYWWSDEITPKDANYGHNVEAGRTSVVGHFPANRFGLYDTHGNVWEWVEDCWHDSYHGAPDDGSAWIAGNDSGHVVRGGSWKWEPGDLRSASRFRKESDQSYNDVGFRVARTLSRSDSITP